MSFVHLNVSIESFLGLNLKYLDFSNNDLKRYESFKIYPTLEVLKLKYSNIDTINELNFQFGKPLVYLDLSHNSLAQLNFEWFKNANALQHLDVSSNRITFIEQDLIDTCFKNLRYFNLESNAIITLDYSVLEFKHLEIFNIGHNLLQSLPYFDFGDNEINPICKFRELYANNNEIKSIQYLSYLLSDLVILNFDLNQISTIDYDAFFNLRNVENLSLSQNYLTNLTENNFYYLFSLKYLILSFNQIEFIALNSFQNLNNLELLDLSFNYQLKAIESNTFLGLNHLKDLNVFNLNDNVKLYNTSFNHLTEISNIYLNESVLNDYKCIFMHSIERIIQRNVSNIYIFYKSINLITQKYSKYSIETRNYCEFTFELLQFKLHLNLKNDYENELFYEICQDYLIRKNNSFTHNLKKCFKHILLSEQYKNLDEKISKNSFISNIYYLSTMGLLVLYFGLVFLLLPLHFYEIF